MSNKNAGTVQNGLTSLDLFSPLLRLLPRDTLPEFRLCLRLLLSKDKLGPDNLVLDVPDVSLLALRHRG